MLLGDRGSRWRCLLVWVSGTSSLAAVMLLVSPRVERLWATRLALRSMSLDVALVDVSAGVLLVCAAWASVALTATVVEAWRGVDTTRRRPWHLPDGVRRMILAACGVALASAATTPALATGAAPHGHPHGDAVLSGLPLPDRAVAPAHPAPVVARHSVIVHRGDSLWSIATDDCPAGSSDGEITHRWHAIYAENRSRIGPDPDVIEPGQRLRLPGKDRP